MQLRHSFSVGFGFYRSSVDLSDPRTGYRIRRKEGSEEMDSEPRKDGKSNKRERGSKGGTDERILTGKSVISTVKAGRVRKPRRGNRAGSKRQRTHKSLTGENGEVGTEDKLKGQPSAESIGKVNIVGGEDAQRRNEKKKKKRGEKSEGNPGCTEDASNGGRLQESVAFVESKESSTEKIKFKSKSKDTLLKGEFPAEEAEKGTVPSKPGPKVVSFLDKMRDRLSGGRFRMLNESLYTCKGDEALELFQQDPGAFDLYHTGYQKQMSRWPVLPVTVVTKWLQSRTPNLVVADFGCGDARLAKSVENKVFSLDLVSSDPSVIVCNMAQTPLETSSVDVAVFCLSLMGTDYPTFLEEAHRVLRSRGWLLIAEVRSRLDEGSGGAGPQAFISAIKALGFVLDSQDSSNKMFHMFYFQKEGSKHQAKRKINWPELKPCIYKRR